VTITNGNYGVQISGADGAHRGDLQIHEAKGWGGLLDAMVDDGAALRENAHGSGFTAVPTAPVDLGPVAHLYTVRSRDTLSSIAKAHGVSLRELVQANPQLANPDRISVGQALNLPQGNRAGTERAVIVSTPAAPAAQAAPSAASAPSAPGTIDYAAMYQKKGHAYRQDQVKSYSHYNEPIDRSAGRAAGNSRIWGDAPAETQRAAIDAIIKASKAAGLSTHETALVLAIASVESGFNPDAAAGTTSAAGLGQFVNRTGKAYGLDAHNRWNVDAQAKALVAHFKENQHLAKANGHGDDYIYKYHHDGPAGDYGGLAIARRKVMPVVSKYEAVLIAATR
jgi:LysM repeat protein